MPVWITLIIQVSGAIIQIVKLIMELRKTDPAKASQATEALRSLRKEGDATAISELCAKLQKGVRNA